MDSPERFDLRDGIQPWELELAAKVARAFRTQDRDDLVAELTRKLLVLKASKPQGVREWKAYVAKFFCNKASNWVRDERARIKREDASLEGVDPRAWDFAESKETSGNDLRLAISPLWAQLDPHIQHFLTILVEENGNQVTTARRLKKHRNTIRLWHSRIRNFLRENGLGDP